jgi:nucleoside-diphosphate-sugar epimerase
MRLAILGATSQIAKDLITQLGSKNDLHLGLFSRRPADVTRWLRLQPVRATTFVGPFEYLSGTSSAYDAIINFVGSGDPARTQLMGADIMSVTYNFDSIALQYLKSNPACRYVFMSSGAAFGGSFEVPVSDKTCSSFLLNQLRPQDWYGVSKMYAETRHRAEQDYAIVDLRIFNYFSSTSDIEARFLITDALRAIRDKTILKTAPDNIWRDYVGPREIAQIVERIIQAEPQNVAVDCFSKSPVDKLSILKSLKSEFGLEYEFTDVSVGVHATGVKSHYYSESKLASRIFDYEPISNAMEIVLNQSRELLSHSL